MTISALLAIFWISDTDAPLHGTTLEFHLSGITILQFKHIFIFETCRRGLRVFRATSGVPDYIPV